MMYVMRDEEGKIIGSFALPQKGFAEEALKDDDPELLEFLAPKPTEVETR